MWEADRKEDPGEIERVRSLSHVATLTKKDLDIMLKGVVNYIASEEGCVSLWVALIRICPTVRNRTIRRRHRLRVCPFLGQSEVVLPLIDLDAHKWGD